MEENQIRIILFIVFCLVIAVVDSKTYRIPDVILILFLCVMSLFDIGKDIFYMAEHLLAAFLGFGVFYFVFTYSGGLGFGDVKYAAVLGYILGVEKMVFLFFFAAFGGIITYVIGFGIFRWGKATKIPFAPFLSLGALVVMYLNVILMGIA